MLGPRARLLLAFGIVGILVASGVAYYAATAPTTTGDQLNVVASFYPYAFLAAQVGGDAVSVANLLPPGVEPHEWEPTPAAIAQVHEADVFVYNGYLEVYLAPLFAELPAGKPLRVNTSADLPMRRTGNGDFDPHVWLDPVLAQNVTTAIERALITVRPSASSTFRANGDRLRAELAGIGGDYVGGLRTCQFRTFVTQHEAFGYLAARYNLTMVAIQGLSPDAEPTPQQLSEVRDLINRTGVRYIFYESLVDPRVAQTLAAEANVGTMVLDPVEGLTAEGAAR